MASKLKVHFAISFFFWAPSPLQYYTYTSILFVFVRRSMLPRYNRYIHITCQIREIKLPFWNFTTIANMANSVPSHSRAPRLMPANYFISQCQHGRRVTADFKTFWQLCTVILFTKKLSAINKMNSCNKNKQVVLYLLLGKDEKKFFNTVLYMEVTQNM